MAAELRDLLRVDLHTQVLGRRVSEHDLRRCNFRRHCYVVLLDTAVRQLDLPATTSDHVPDEEALGAWRRWPELPDVGTGERRNVDRRAERQFATLQNLRPQFVKVLHERIRLHL